MGFRGSYLCPSGLTIEITFYGGSSDEVLLTKVDGINISLVVASVVGVAEHQLYKFDVIKSIHLLLSWI
jgi:hypothetical protein